MSYERREMMNKTAVDLRAVADDLERLAVMLDDGLGDDPLLDDHGYPVEMDRDERRRIEDREQNEGLAAVVESNRAGEEVSIEAIRSVLVDKKRAGYSNEIRALLGEYGTERVSNLGKDDYMSFLAKARLIGEAS